MALGGPAGAPALPLDHQPPATRFCSVCRMGARSPASQNLCEGYQRTRCPMWKHLAASEPLPLVPPLLVLLLASPVSLHHPRRAPGTEPGGPSRPSPALSLTSCPPGSLGTWPTPPGAAPPPGRPPRVPSRPEPGLGGRSPLGRGSSGRLRCWGVECGRAVAAGRGRCPFKVPPPRGRETACTSPIPLGSARNKKHNA